MRPHYECIVVGASSGGLQALFTVLGPLTSEFPIPILIVQHLLPTGPSSLAAALDGRVALRVREAADKLTMRPGEVYVGVPDYHLTVERDATGGSSTYLVGLSQDPPECFSRPAVNVLFETAAVATEGRLIGVVLTGANDDGARGAACLKRWGGHLLVQDPRTAEYRLMPAATLAATFADRVGTTAELGAHLCKLGASNECRE